MEEPPKDIEILCCYPTIKQLFVHFNARLPSSAPAVRLFSFAGIVTRHIALLVVWGTKRLRSCYF